MVSRYKYSIGLLKKHKKEYLKNFPHFVTLCCGILTIETPDCFFRSFCFTGQNGAFSTTEQNGGNFLGVLFDNSSGNPAANFSRAASRLLACGKPEFIKKLFARFLLVKEKNFQQQFEQYP